MLNTRLSLSRRTAQVIRHFLRSAVLGIVAVYSLGCHADHGLAPLPPGDGALTGKWIQPSVDTWIQLELSQSGSRVVGYHIQGSANFGGSLTDSVWVTGDANLPHVTLQWTDYGQQWTMDATLSADGDSLTGTWSTTGYPPVSFFRFQRAAH